MIYRKEIVAPGFRRRSVRREISLFAEKSGSVSAYGLHFRDGGRGIVCAEGARSLGAEKQLIATKGHAEELFGCEDGMLRSPAGESYPLSSLPNQLLCFVSEAGEKEYFALMDNVCLRIKTDGAESVGVGGVCGAVHGERIFTANGFTLCWTAPLHPDGRAEGTQKMGHTDLPSADGSILEMISFRDELYLFRERGIAVLAVRGDALDFTAKHLPAPGEIAAGSVRKCGNGIYFLSGNELYRFDGKKYERLNAGGFSELDLEGACTAVCGDRYFATARFNGENCIWCVQGEKGHLIRARAEKLFGGEKLLFAAEGELFELTERGLPPMRKRECVLKTEHSLFGLSLRPKYLDGILIEGRGHFHIEARGERGLPRAVFGRAGEALRFPLPVRGAGFTLKLKTLDEDACVKAVVLDLREEVAKW